MRQLDAEPARGAENRLAVADIDLAVVDGEGFRGRRITLAGDLVDRRRVGHARLAIAISRAARGAFFIVAVTGWFLSVAVAHSI